MQRGQGTKFRCGNSRLAYRAITRANGNTFPAVDAVRPPTQIIRSAEAKARAAMQPIPDREKGTALIQGTIIRWPRMEHHLGIGPRHGSHDAVQNTTTHHIARHHSFTAAPLHLALYTLTGPTFAMHICIRHRWFFLQLRNAPHTDLPGRGAGSECRSDSHEQALIAEGEP